MIQHQYLIKSVYASSNYQNGKVLLMVSIHCVKIHQIYYSIFIEDITVASKSLCK